MEVDEGPELTTGPINKGSESIEMDVGANGGVDPGIKFEIDGVVRLLVPSMKLCLCFKTLHIACPYVDLNCTNIFLLCKTTMSNPSSFGVHVFNSCNVSHNLSSKFLPRSLILSSPIYMKHNNLPHYIRNELCIFIIVFVIDSKVMLTGNTHAAQASGLHNGMVSFLSLWCF